MGIGAKKTLTPSHTESQQTAGSTTRGSSAISFSVSDVPVHSLHGFCYSRYWGSLGISALFFLLNVLVLRAALAGRLASDFLSEDLARSKSSRTSVGISGQCSSEVIPEDGHPASAASCAVLAAYRRARDVVLCSMSVQPAAGCRASEAQPASL